MSLREDERNYLDRYSSVCVITLITNYFPLTPLPLPPPPPPPHHHHHYYRHTSSPSFSLLFSHTTFSPPLSPLPSTLQSEDLRARLSFSEEHRELAEQRCSALLQRSNQQESVHEKLATQIRDIDEQLAQYRQDAEIMITCMKSCRSGSSC